MTKVYEDRKVYLGYEDLTGATLRRCTLVYTGKKFKLQNVAYENCWLALEGDAAGVVATLAAFYKAGPEFQSQVKAILGSITGDPDAAELQERPKPS